MIFKTKTNEQTRQNRKTHRYKEKLVVTGGEVGKGVKSKKVRETKRYKIPAVKKNKLRDVIDRTGSTVYNNVKTVDRC